MEGRAAYDTAGASARGRPFNDPTRGAIAGRPAAARYGLVVLAADVEDRPDNQTRFVVVSRAPSRLADGTVAKSILILSTPNTPGALVRVLVPIAERGLNLTKIESRPTGEPWTYRFVLEFEHVAGDLAANEALRAVRSASASFHIAGTYDCVTDLLTRRRRPATPLSAPGLLSGPAAVPSLCLRTRRQSSAQTGRRLAAVARKTADGAAAVEISGSVR